MRVLIISLSDERHMPMISTYISYLNQREIQYDIIRSNRYVARKEDYIAETQHGTIYEFNMVFPPSTSKLKKIIPFLQFYRKAIREINRNHYSFVIVWNENTAALFSMFLRKKYNNRYCINIRDIYTHQIGIRSLVEYAIKHSVFTTVPSPEMITNYPSKTICVFNKDVSLLKLIAPKQALSDRKNPIRITHMGFYSKVQQGAKDIVDALGNDNRYELYFYGQGFDTDFKEYVNEKGYNNVFLFGSFPYEDTAKILQNTDIINSYYNRFNHPSLQVSFGIKHSYTPMLYIPGLADENTCWGRLSRQYNLAYLINSKNIATLADDLYKWYINLQFSEFKNNCDTFNKYIDHSIAELYEILNKCIKESVS